MLKRIMAAYYRASDVLGMNRRNLDYVYPYNARCHFPIANDKLLCKETLQRVGVPVPQTYFTYRYFFELATLEGDLLQLNEFVIKPAQGSAGNGIVVIVGREGNEWIGISGKRYGLSALRRHLSDIIFGVFSFDNADTAIIEQRIIQHEDINRLYDGGLADVRVILFKERPVLAMCRLPTDASDGKANLHQGAIGLGLDLNSGFTTHAFRQGMPLSHHPDSHKALEGVAIPHWQSLMEYAQKAARAVPLKYLGVDVALAQEGPVMLEINARPGLEIQNANRQPLRDLLESRS